MKNKKNIILVTIFAVGFFVTFVVFRYINRNNIFYSYKIKKNNPIVYTIYQEDRTSVPTINLKGQTIQDVNDEITKKANDLLGKEDNEVSYLYSVNGQILSLTVIYSDYARDIGYPLITPVTYNYDIKNKKLLSSTELLNIFNVTESTVEKKIKETMYSYYEQEVEEKILTSDCDYNCFLKSRGMEDNNFLQDVQYYISKGQLYAVKGFDIYSRFEEEKFFTLEHFYINITE